MEVLPLLKSILDAVGEIDTIVDEWCNVSEDYKAQVGTLRERVKTYEAQSLMYNLPEDDFAVKQLRRAQDLLVKEEKKVRTIDDGFHGSQCCAGAWWLYAKVTMVFFPQKLEKIIKKVRDELDTISSTETMQANVSDEMRQKNERQALPTTVHNNDGLYVPIKESQTAVTKAIEDSKGPPIVLLHGGVGKGKSTLAKYACALYGDGGAKGYLFDHVILVPCGNCAIPDPFTKQFQILQDLAPTMVGSEASKQQKRIAENLNNFLRHKRILIILDDVSDSAFLLAMWAAAAESRYVKCLVTSQLHNLCGSLTKTSVAISMQNPNEDEARRILASLLGLGDQQIPSEVEDMADNMIRATEGNPLALACLARNFAFSQDKDVIKDRTRWEHAYSELCELLDNEGNISVFGNAPRSLWAAMKLCIDSLANKDAKILLFLMYSCEGPSVADEVLQVLFQRTKSKSGSFYPSMDELVTRELVKRSSGTQAPETKLQGENQARYLENSTVWSLRSLVKLYMEHNMVGKDETSQEKDLGAKHSNDRVKFKSMITSLVGNEPNVNRNETEETEKARVAAVLCALYFDRAHPDGVVRDAATKASKFYFDGAHPDEVSPSPPDRLATASIAGSNVLAYQAWSLESEGVNNLRRAAIEPLIRLLGKPVNKLWTNRHVGCVRKAFLKYVCERKLEENSIAALLTLIEYPSAPLAALMAIRAIFRIEVNSLMSENPHLIFDALANLCDREIVSARILETAPNQKAYKEISFLLQEETIKALVVMSWKTLKEKAAFSISSTSSILDKLGVLLQDSGTENSVREYAVKILCNLAAGEDSMKKVIINDDRALASLAYSLSDHHDSNLREPAARTLINLASIKEHHIRWNIVKENQVLVGLVTMLSNPCKPRLCEAALDALYCLASGEDGEAEVMRIRETIVRQDGALTGLAKALSYVDHLHLQSSAANVLGTLARVEDVSVRMKIADQAEALDGLVKSLVQQNNPYLQERAASALANLAIGEDEKPRLKILDHDAALVSLVKSLSSDGNPGLLDRAARALANLASDDDDEKRLHNASIIVNQNGALASLVNLAQHKTYDVSLRAKQALINLLFEIKPKIRYEVGLEIVTRQGALESLVQILSGDHPGLREVATKVLENVVSWGKDWIKIKVVNQEGALAGLVKVLFQGRPQLQEVAARTFFYLAACGKARTRLIATNGLRQCLSDLRAEHVCPATRDWAIAALKAIDGNPFSRQAPLAKV